MDFALQVWTSYSVLQGRDGQQLSVCLSLLFRMLYFHKHHLWAFFPFPNGPISSVLYLAFGLKEHSLRLKCHPKLLAFSARKGPMLPETQWASGMSAETGSNEPRLSHTYSYEFTSREAALSTMTATRARTTLLMSPLNNTMQGHLQQPQWHLSAGYGSPAAPRGCTCAQSSLLCHLQGRRASISDHGLSHIVWKLWIKWGFGYCPRIATLPWHDSVTLKPKAR